MDGKLERIIQLWQTDQKNHSPVPGVHLKVEQDLQVVKDSIFDIVRFIDDDNWCLPFIQGKAVDLLLDDVKVFSLPVGWLCSQGCGEIPVEIIHRNGRKAGIDHLIQGRVQSGRPGTDQSCFSTTRSAGKKAEAFGPGKVIQTKLCFCIFGTFKKDFFGILSKRIEFQAITSSEFHQSSPPVRRTLSRFTEALSCLLRRRIGVRDPSVSTIKMSFISGV